MMLALATTLALTAHAAPSSSFAARTTDAKGAPRVIVAERPTTMATLRITFAMGSVDDQARAGMTRLAQHMIVHGNASLPAAAFADRLFEEGATLELETGLREASFVLTSPAPAFDALAAQLLRGVLAPRLREDAFEATVARARQDEDVAGSGASVITAIAGAAVEDWHYKNAPNGDPDLVEMIGFEELQAHVARLRPALATVVLAGRFDAPKLTALAGTFRGGVEQEASRPRMHLPADLMAASFYEMHAFGFPLPLTEPSRVAEARILAALLHERVHRRFRDAGVAYSSFAWLERQPWLDFVVAVVPVRSGQLETTGKVMAAVLAELAQGTLADDELERAKATTLEGLLRTDVDPAALALELDRTKALPMAYGPDVLSQVQRVSRDALVARMKTCFRAENTIHLNFSQGMKLDEMRDAMERRLARARRARGRR